MLSIGIIYLIVIHLTINTKECSWLQNINTNKSDLKFTFAKDYTKHEPKLVKWLDFMNGLFASTCNTWLSYGTSCTIHFVSFYSCQVHCETRTKQPKNFYFTARHKKEKLDILAPMTNSRWYKLVLEITIKNTSTT